MSDQPTIAFKIRHELPRSFLELDTTTRREVETKLLEQLHNLKNADGSSAMAALETVTAASMLGVASVSAAVAADIGAVLTWEEIVATFEARVAALGPDYTIDLNAPENSGALTAECRTCGDRHCDRVCATLWYKGNLFFIGATVNGVTWRAQVYLEIEFPSDV